MRSSICLLLAVSVFVRATIPVGFMPASFADGRGMMLCAGDYLSSLLLTLEASGTEDRDTNHHHMPDGHEALVVHGHSGHAAFDKVCDFYLAASFGALAAGEAFDLALTGRVIKSSVYGYRDPYSNHNYLPRVRAPPSSSIV